MDEVTVFWDANFSNIMISLGVGFVFFVLGPAGVWFSGRRIRKERIRKAKEMLIDLIEGMIVTQEKITTAKLKQLFNAVEREVETTIDSEYDLERLFEDVSLRFQRSKHLDSNQKDTYSATLLTLSEALEGAEESGKRVMPRGYKTLLEELRISISENNAEKANAAIDEIEEKVSKIPQEAESFIRIFSMQKKLVREHPVIVGFVVIAYLVFIVLVTTGTIK